MADDDRDDNTVNQKYFWYCYDDIGFPKRVNHAAAMHVDKKSGDAYVYSEGYTPLEVTMPI